MTSRPATAPSRTGSRQSRVWPVRGRRQAAGTAPTTPTRSPLGGAVLVSGGACASAYSHRNCSIARMDTGSEVPDAGALAHPVLRTEPVQISARLFLETIVRAVVRVARTG